MRRSFAAIVLLLCACRLAPVVVPPPPVVAAQVIDAGQPDAGGEAPDAGLAELDAGTASMALPPPPDDPVGAMYSKRLDFRGGDPMVAIRLMEGGHEVAFSPRGQLRMRVNGPVEKRVEAPAGSRWHVRLTEGRPAQLLARVQLAEFSNSDRAGVEAEQAIWTARGVPTRVQTLGSVYGIAGKVIDNRKLLLVTEESQPLPEAKQRQAEILRQYGLRTFLAETLSRPASGILELLDADRNPVALAQDRIIAETVDGSGFAVDQVEYGVGYDFHGFEDRRYRGSLMLAVDREGGLAVINLVPLEELLYGLVPSEIFARAHPEALKAQAVTARGEVLAKVGTKHLADPYLLCSEQHCAVYKGLSGEAASTNAAVQATHGEALFSQEERLVDSVYSAVCGGHTEDNDIVWGGMPNPSLRGRPDVLPGVKVPMTPRRSIEGWLAADVPAMCRVSSFAQPSKYRWERRFTAEEANRLTRHLNIGALQAMAVTDRGVSGRARLLSLSGTQGATQIRGELNIRRLFGMLNSAMFVVSAEKGPDGQPASWVFRGGGWGHGVGMCQTGAIGRAEAGQDYRAILRHYFNGAEVASIY